MIQKEKILEIVLSQFRRYGIRSITMDDISARLGVSKKTLYTEFTDKLDLINRVIDYDMDQSRKLLQELLGTSPKALEELFLVNRQIHALRACYSPSFYYDLRRYYPETYQRWIKDKRRSMYALITENLRKGKKEGVYRQDIDERVIGQLYMARVEMLDSNEIIVESDSRSSEFMQEVFTYHLHGICNEKGLEILSRIEDKNENQQVRQA